MSPVGFILLFLVGSISRDSDKKQLGCVKRGSGGPPGSGVSFLFSLSLTCVQVTSWPKKFVSSFVLSDCKMPRTYRKGVTGLLGLLATLKW